MRICSAILLFQRRIDRQLADDDAVELLQIVVLVLEEGELVALVILRHGEAERRDRIECHQSPASASRHRRSSW